MPAFDPQLLAADCAGSWTQPPRRAISGFAIDTRQLEPGELFVALRTERRDGHAFLGAAREGGAAGALVSEPREEVDLPQLVVGDTLEAFHEIAAAHRRRFRGKVVGITGSAGKTSTKDILAILLGGPSEVLATEGNLNNHLGVPLTLLKIAPSVHRFAVVEAGISGPGEMDVIAAMIQPDVAIVTIVAAAHLDRLGSVKGVSDEKARLIGHLRSGGVAVFPVDCLAYPAFRNLGGPAFVTVGIREAAEALPAWAEPVAVAVRQREHATEICVSWRGRLEEFAMRRTTLGMAGNAALAIVAALHLGVSEERIRQRLPAWRPSRLRGTIIEQGNRLLYLDCYNANPASMADALEAFLGIAPEEAPRLFVIGCMEELGADAEALHRRTGRHWPVRPQDRLVVLGTHAAALAEGVREHVPGAAILVNPEPEEVRELVAGFEGAIFLKGSRRYALETFVDGLDSQAAETGETAA